jgi:hypothetical protein
MNRVVFKSLSVHWPTPRKVYDELHAEFDFDLDPCPLGSVGSDGAPIDGTSPLFCSWKGRRVFCNPPYGNAMVPFLHQAENADVAVFLIPARTDTRWFHGIILPKADEIRFIKGRLKFGDAKYNAPFPSMVVVFRKEPRS